MILGNPIKYLGHDLTWEKGRQLKSFDSNTYTYNAAGIRTAKTVNGVKHTYALDGTKILRETWGDNTLIPLYDNEASVCGILYNDTPYYFLKNLQGDIIAITNQNGQTVAKYTYDAWGKCTFTSDSSDCAIATINPFRYRGYYYDPEIGMYYLQSRYYDPVIGRFINADNSDFPVTNTPMEVNRFAYCLNNPVDNADVLGNIATFLAKKIGQVVFGAAISIAAQFLGDVLMSAIKRQWKLSTAGTYISAVAKGAWDGLWGGGLAKEICKSMLTNILSQLVDKIRKGKAFDFVGVITSIFDGILSYVIDKFIKVPKYIRDIKAKARSQGIKGTKKLINYLNKEIWKKLSFKLTFSAISNFVTQLIGKVINYASTCAKEMYNALKNEIGGLAIA